MFGKLSNECISLENKYYTKLKKYVFITSIMTIFCILIYLFVNRSGFWNITNVADESNDLFKDFKAKFNRKVLYI